MREVVWFIGGKHRLHEVPVKSSAWKQNWPNWLEASVWGSSSIMAMSCTNPTIKRRWFILITWYKVLATFMAQNLMPCLLVATASPKSATWECEACTKPATCYNNVCTKSDTGYHNARKTIQLRISVLAPQQQKEAAIAFVGTCSSARGAKA